MAKLTCILMANEYGDNVHLPTTFLCTLFLGLFLSGMLFTPKQLKLVAGGGLLVEFFNNPLEGYRTPLAIKITQNTHFKTHLKQGGARKVSL